jgi:hypothetical protein
MGKLIFTAGQPAQDPAQPTYAQLIRLIVTPHGAPGSKGPRFAARLDDTVLTISHEPMVAAARVLIERGRDPTAFLTLRMHDRAYDSFKPTPIGELAKWTFEERDRDGLRRVRWMPRQLHAGGQKSTSMAGREVLATPLAEIALRRHLS